MSRSLKKGPYVDQVLYEKVRHARSAGSGVAIKTWSRSCTIVPEFVGQWLEIHNGKGFVKVFVTEDMVGHKLGEFAQSRTFRGHGGNGGK